MKAIALGRSRAPAGRCRRRRSPLKIRLTRSFRENTPAGQNIGAPVQATFTGGTLTYTLEGTDAGSFDIDEETGRIKTRTG